MSGFTMKRKKAPKIYPYKQHRLMWPPSLYKEWYLHAKLANPKIKTFDEWFNVKKYAEPMQDDDVKIVKQKGNKLVLEFDLTNDLRRLGLNFLKVITKYKDEYTYHSLAKVQPSKPIVNNVDAMRKDRIVYSLHLQGLKNHQIAYKLNYIDKDLYEWKEASRGTKIAFKKKHPAKDDKLKKKYATEERKIQRAITNCKKILKNVKLGGFP